MSIISSDLYLEEVFKKYPGALEVFLTNGFEDFADNDAFIEIGSFVKLKTILKTRNINEKFFVGLLEDRINNSRLMNPNLDVKDKMNFLALLPCPLKLPIQEAFAEFLKKSNFNKKNKLDFLIEGNANNQLSYYSYVEQFEEISEIPDIVISPGINGFYYKEFMEKFISKGFFTDVSEYLPKNEFINIEIKDPGGNYTILCVNLLVMVVDKLKIGNMPIPKKWGDLLNPEFKKGVAIRGHNNKINSFCETTLLSIFKEFGFDGIKKLGESVKYGWHPAQMAKIAGSGSNDSPTVSVMPYFFTKTIKYKKNVEIIWPEDGAIVSPVTMLVKSEKAMEMKEIADFFTGKGVGNICAAANFPTLNPHVNNNLPEKANFNWIGWEFIMKNDMGNLVKKLNSEFAKYYIKN